MNPKNWFEESHSEMPKPWWWVFIGFLILGGLILPMFTEIDVHLDMSIIFIFALLSLSMGFLWGYGGMLSFGQTIFFGLGGYTYAIWSLNFNETTFGLILAVFVPLLVSCALGYFMIYGRISNIYFTVTTLVTTIVLEKAVRATSDERFVIGSVRLKGQNGISSVPDLQIPWNPDETLFLTGVYYVTFVALFLTYIALRMLLITHFGRVLVSIRENENRTELLGYDARRYKLGAFVISGGIAGLAGALYGIWGNFVAPEMMNLNSAANIVMYVIVGGKSTLIGPIFGTAVVQRVTTELGMAGVGQVTLYLGLMLIIFVMVFPRGILPTLGTLTFITFDKIRNYYKNNFDKGDKDGQ